MDKEQLGEAFSAKQQEWTRENKSKEREKEAIERKRQLYTEIAQKALELFPMTDDDNERLKDINNYFKVRKTDDGNGARFRFSRQAYIVPMPQIDNIPLGAIKADVHFDQYFEADTQAKGSGLFKDAFRGPDYEYTNVRGTEMLDFVRVRFIAEKPSGETGEIARYTCGFRPENDSLQELEEVASSLSLIENAMALQAS